MIRNASLVFYISWGQCFLIGSLYYSLVISFINRVVAKLFMCTHRLPCKLVKTSTTFPFNLSPLLSIKVTVSFSFIFILIFYFYRLHIKIRSAQVQSTITGEISQIRACSLRDGFKESNNWSMSV